MTDGIDLKELERRSQTREYEARLEQSDTAGQPYVRVSEHPLDVYFTRSVITERQFNAGATLRKDFELAHSLSASPYDGTPCPEVYFSRTPPQNQIEAAASYSEAFREIGTTMGVPLVKFCCHGRFLHEIWEHNTGNKLARGKAQGRIQAALDILADYYGY